MKWTTSREIRLWITNVGLPVAGAALTVAALPPVRRRIGRGLYEIGWKAKRLKRKVFRR